ncbi:type II toxin-antitoxin system death-on-curing family toxin [Pseudovibrio sp. WM33]|uniref:type II toxin-antitoxin system death-on-curing family toxin n=1 Tax=Pseudovibrio sp. WM33 TaxID=1735585 RepID=UPI0007AEB8DD|nr:type II toxin-antitoxin system death-on-curing family toxin [Pseudovibrio sp. WM33]KZL28365.1 Fic/DOC family protein [Pseudovibrio sp. WM33]
MEPQWLEFEFIVELNRLAVQKTGEPFGIIGEDKLLGALGRVQTRWHYNEEQDILMLGICLLESIANAHPFSQGNKRTAFQAMEEFLYINGYDLIEPEEEYYHDAIIQLITHEIRSDVLWYVMAPHMRPLPQEETAEIGDFLTRPGAAL